MSLHNNFAYFLVLKYIGYYAELPINLPKEIEERIVNGMLKTGVNQSECCGVIQLVKDGLKLQFSKLMTFYLFQTSCLKPFTSFMELGFSVE